MVERKDAEIKSESLVLFSTFFCHCIFSTLTRLDPAMFHRLSPRHSFTASGLHLHTSRFTTSRETFGLSDIKYFFRRLHIARVETFHYYLGFFFFSCLRLTARHRTVADAVSVSAGFYSTLLCAGKGISRPSLLAIFPSLAGACFLP